METGKLGPIEEVQLAELASHPANTRGKIGKEDVADLVESIRAAGVLEPLIVKHDQGGKEGDYLILSGHRRAAAARVLEFDTVPCRRFTGSADDALRIIELANRDRAEPDLFREAELVESFVEKGWSVPDTAAFLGKKPRFVGALCAVAKIEPSVRKAMQSEKCSWTIDMVLEFAKIAPEAQAAAWKELKNEDDIEDLRHYSRNRFLLLSTASWDLQDPNLLPAAGSCAACPKTSLRAPGLFDDAELDPTDPAALKKGTCRDLGCWALKARAQLGVEVAAHETETGKPPAQISDSHGDEAKALGKMGEVVHTYDVQKAAKGAKGAVPAIDVRSGKTSWIKKIERNSYGQPKKKKPAGKPKPPTVKERADGLFARRDAWIVDHVRDEIVQKLAKPEEHTLSVQILFAIFGGRAHFGFDSGDVKTGGLRKVVEGIGGEGARAIAVFERVKDPLCRFLTRVNLDKIARQVDDAYIVAELFGFNRAELVKSAEFAIPTPKGLLKDVGDAVSGGVPAKPSKVVHIGPVVAKHDKPAKGKKKPKTKTAEPAAAAAE